MTAPEPGQVVHIKELHADPKPCAFTSSSTISFTSGFSGGFTTGFSSNSSSGFFTGQAGRALGVYKPLEGNEPYLLLSNERNKIWLVCNQPVGIHKPFLVQQSFGFRSPGAARCHLALM